MHMATITHRIDEELKQLLDRYCEEHGLKAQAVVQEAIAQWLETRRIWSWSRSADAVRGSSGTRSETTYRVVLHAAVPKELRKLPPKTRERAKAVIDGLKQEPIPVGAGRLRGRANAYRIRIGATGLSTRCTRPKSLSMSWASPTGGKCIVEFSNGGNRRFHGLSITRDVGAPAASTAMSLPKSTLEPPM